MVYLFLYEYTKYVQLFKNHICSLPLSIYLQEFVLTNFLGMDVVARLGVINMEKLKTDLLAIIKNSRLPKVC